MGLGIIRPSSDLRNRYGEISRLCHESRQPVYITVNGRGDTVLLGMQQYQQIVAELELLRMLAEAQEDVAAGHVAPIGETFGHIRQSLTIQEDEK